MTVKERVLLFGYLVIKAFLATVIVCELLYFVLSPLVPAAPTNPPHIPLPMFAYQNDDRHLDGYLILPLPKTEWCSRVDSYFSIEGASHNGIPSGVEFANCMVDAIVIPSPNIHCVFESDEDGWCIMESN